MTRQYQTPLLSSPTTSQTHPNISPHLPLHNIQTSTALLTYHFTATSPQYPDIHLFPSALFYTPSPLSPLHIILLHPCLPIIALHHYLSIIFHHHFAACFSSETTRRWGCVMNANVFMAVYQWALHILDWCCLVLSTTLWLLCNHPSCISFLDQLILGRFASACPGVSDSHQLGSVSLSGDPHVL